MTMDVETENTPEYDFVETCDLLKYIGNSATAVLEPKQREIEQIQYLDDIDSIWNILNHENGQALISHFIQDSTYPIFCIFKCVHSDMYDEENSKRIISIKYICSNKIVETFVKCICFVKYKSHISKCDTIDSQIHMSTFGFNNFYNELYCHFSYLLGPIFGELIKKNLIDNIPKKSLLNIEDQLGEIELNLVKLQKNTDIPNVQLPINDNIREIINLAIDSNAIPTIDDLGELKNNNVFLNNLQEGVNRWINSIQKITKLNHDIDKTTTLQEIQFWFHLESTLSKLISLRKSTGVKMTIEVLKQAKRFHATTSFERDTGVEKLFELVCNYNILLKDFPINDLLAASTLDKISSSLNSIFNHMRKIRNSNYPVTRLVKLTEAVSRDLCIQMNKVICGKKILTTPFDEFLTKMKEAMDIFYIWEDNFDKLLSLLREINKKKRDESIKPFWRCIFPHMKLKDQICAIQKLRKHYEKFVNVIKIVLKSKTFFNVKSDENGVNKENKFRLNPIDEIAKAYSLLLNCNPLVIDREGKKNWDDCVKLYNEEIDKFEMFITSQLRRELSVARNANEMFSIFSKYNPLFVRSRIRGAIREYQSQLIKTVKSDIEDLYEIGKLDYSKSSASKLSLCRDIPPVSGKILWLRMLERRLHQYLRRIEQVLGTSWQQHVEGQQLKSLTENFMKKLDSTEIYENWIKDVKNDDSFNFGSIFLVEKFNKNSTFRNKIGDYLLSVNFPPTIIVLAKEVRQLKLMGFRIPLSIANKAHTTKNIYPVGIVLIEHVKLYNNVLRSINLYPSIYSITSKFKSKVEHLIREGCSLTWESYKMDMYIQKLSETIIIFNEKVNEALTANNQIDEELKLLENCIYENSKFAKIVSNINNSILELSLSQFSYLNVWKTNLQSKIDTIISKRILIELKVWMENMKFRHVEKNLNNLKQKTILDKDGSSKRRKPHKKYKYEVLIDAENIYLNPTIENLKSTLYNDFYSLISVVTSVASIEIERDESASDYLAAIDANNNVIERLMKNESFVVNINESITSIENLVLAVEKIMLDWTHYCSFWNIDMKMLASEIGLDLMKWITEIENIVKEKKYLDSLSSSIQYGFVVIDVCRVELKVINRYDILIKDALNIFSEIMSDKSNIVYSKITFSRSYLEKVSFTCGTTESIQNVTKVKSIRDDINDQKDEIDIFKECQKLLIKNHFHFSRNWLHVDQVEAEWSALNSILQRREELIESQLASLQSQVIAEQKNIASRTEIALEKWSKEKPIKAENVPSLALESITVFSTLFANLKTSTVNIEKAFEILNISSSGANSTLKTQLEVYIDELNDMKNLWIDMNQIFIDLEELENILFKDVVPTNLRKSVEKIIKIVQQMPLRNRQYPCYEYTKKKLQNYLKTNAIISMLHGEHMRERHWIGISEIVSLTINLEQINIGALWKLNLLAYETEIKQIIIVAQGEMALEIFLKQIKEIWKHYRLELVYQKKCNIITGWDKLFNTVTEHISSINAMKNSPYFKQFEQDSQIWDNTLNNINAIFDTFVNIQRKWIYLDGIFSESLEIKQLLPSETSLFQSVNQEFLGIMHKVARSTLILEIIKIPNIERQLNRLFDLLVKIKKSLGDFLEQQRRSFARFYFIGDDDLLELIGNSKSINSIQKHFSKMFANIERVIINIGESVVILGIESKEHERFIFEKTININPKESVCQWLRKIENEIKFSLKCKLSNGVIAAEKYFSYIESDPNKTHFLTFLDETLSQIILLCQKIYWAHNVEICLYRDTDEDIIKNLNVYEKKIENFTEFLSEKMFSELNPLRLKKMESLTNEFVKERDTVLSLISIYAKKEDNYKENFYWIRQLRYYYNFKEKSAESNDLLKICIADSVLNYGYEYLGVEEKLVQTSLTDDCYLVMTQALKYGFGGSPFGPAGTGKTETIKSLGSDLGKFVLVFNCDENFDFQAMGRLFIGLCQVGAWGCFDEFNRLEERMLSAVSQQIQTIQNCLKLMETDKTKNNIMLLGNTIKVNPSIAIFITMNPGYSGRSSLPDNLVQLFRSFSMNHPDKKRINQVMLFTRGFKEAENISERIVMFFELCSEQLTNQKHYDFGLRSMKSVIVAAGKMKRQMSQSQEFEENNYQVILKSINQTVLPKLIVEDVKNLKEILSIVFAECEIPSYENKELARECTTLAEEWFLEWRQNEAFGEWAVKVMQIYQISLNHHGIILVGSTATGKTMSWKILLEALSRIEKIKHIYYIINPKALNKSSLFGKLDINTREWTDGIFTHHIRKILENSRGEQSKRIWIVFDGDVDPEWVENLNSVLDDNKILTLPNGERLHIPNNVKIFFEVENLKYATHATISRCGMIWFGKDTVTPQMILNSYLIKLNKQVIQLDSYSQKYLNTPSTAIDTLSKKQLETQQYIANVVLVRFFKSEAIVLKCLEFIRDVVHVMEFCVFRSIFNFLSFLNIAIQEVFDFNYGDNFSLTNQEIERFIGQKVIYSIMWSFTGDSNLSSRDNLSKYIHQISTIDLPNKNETILNYN
ncbi:Dynein heavy chain, cytoplasmic, partial [Intoshia linei]